MADTPRKDVYNVLFLCTGNSVRSIMAESLLNHWGRGRYRALPIERLSRTAIQYEIARIGQDQSESAA